MKSTATTAHTNPTTAALVLTGVAKNKKNIEMTYNKKTEFKDYMAHLKDTHPEITGYEHRPLEYRMSTEDREYTVASGEGVEAILETLMYRPEAVEELIKAVLFEVHLRSLEYEEPKETSNEVVKPLESEPYRPPAPEVVVYTGGATAPELLGQCSLFDNYLSNVIRDGRNDESTQTYLNVMADVCRTFSERLSKKNNYIKAYQGLSSLGKTRKDVVLTVVERIVDHDGKGYILVANASSALLPYYIISTKSRAINLLKGTHMLSEITFAEEPVTIGGIQIARIIKGKV